MKFKIANHKGEMEIEGPSLTAIKFSLILTYGRETPIFLYQKTIEKCVLLYCPTEADLNNLAKRSWIGYVEDNIELLSTIRKSIK